MNIKAILENIPIVNNMYWGHRLYSSYKTSHKIAEWQFLLQNICKIKTIYNTNRKLTKSSD